MGVHISAVGGTVVVKGIRSLSSHCRRDIGLLSPVSSSSVDRHVLLSLKNSTWHYCLFCAYHIG